MRRLLALVTAVVVTLSLAAAPAAARAYLRVRETRVLSPGGTTKIEVAADSSVDITKVRAVVRPYSGGTAEPLTVDDFELVEGTAANGVWRTRSAVAVEQGRWWVDVELANADVTTVFRQRATIDNGLDTVITDFDVTPRIVDVEHPEVAFGGRLMSRGADGALAPVEGATLRLNGAAGPAPTVVTGADGRVQGTGDVVTTADAQLTYGGGFLYRPAKSAEIPIAKVRLQTRLSLAMPARLIVGDQVTVTGRLERRDRAGVWAPLAGKQLSLSFNATKSGDWSVVGRPVTGADGGYTAKVTVTEPGAWSVTFANEPQTLPDDYYGYLMSSAYTTNRPVAYRTSVTGFNAAPEPVGRGNMVTGSGRVMNRLADGRWVGAASNATAQLQFSTDRKKWSTKAVVGVNGDGTFRFEGRADRDGYWRAVVPRGDYAEPSVGGTDYVDVRYRTKILDFNAAPEPVRKGGTVTVMGALYRETDRWKPYGSKTIAFYFLPKGSSKWTYMGSQKADKYGRFRKGFKATKDGTWRAYTSATSSYIKTYRDDYVDVR